MAGDDSTYVWANPDELADSRRLESLEGWFDPLTHRHLETIGIGVGWRCLEVGAGGGSIARWLAQRVGPSGSVVATDVDVRFLTGLPAMVEVRRHDVVSDALESGRLMWCTAGRCWPTCQTRVRRWRGWLAPWPLVDGWSSRRPTQDC